MKRLILAAMLLIALNAAAQQPAPDRIRQYTYDADGNITQIDADAYVYDSVDRIISGTVSDRVRQYTYDAFGNRRRCKGIYQNAESDCQYTAQITASTNHIIGAVYDSPGNLQSYAGQSYTYDAVGAITSNGTIDYVYNADDERIAIIDGVQWGWTLRDGADKVLREVTSTAAADGSHSNWQWTRDNVFRNSTILSSVDPSGTRNYHTDHLGTPRVVSDTTGAIIGVHDYVPFGLEVIYDPFDPFHPSEPNPGHLKFTGHERDEDGLDYMHARYYSAPWGRFLSVDPVMDLEKIVHEPQLWNRYTYVGSNPMKFTDPDGKERLQFYHFGIKPRQVSAVDGAASGAKIGLQTGAVLFGGPMLRAGWQVLVSFVLGNPQGARQLADAALAPPGSSAIIPGPVNSQYGKLDYLLGEVPNSVKSQGLGGFFKGELGYSKETAAALGDALKGQFAANFGTAVVNDKGLYEVTGQIAGANGKTAVIRSVWEKVGENVYKFVTAVPDH